MEQARYLMWMERRSLLKSQFQELSMNSINIGGSWEERAFAEDAAAGSLGGCIWPPRSYSCSFCKREFRSAQALGGHMNVHRRDRARLKQSLNTPPHNDDAFQHQNHTVDNNIYDPDPKYSASSTATTTTTNNNNVASTFSASRVSANLSTHENLSDHRSFVSPFSSSTTSQEKYKGSPYLYNTSDSKPDQAENTPGDHVEYSTCLSHDGFVATDLFVGLSSFGDETMISCKRPKTSTTVSALSFLIQPCSRHSKLQSDVIGLNSSSMEADLDLELRLGEPQKVMK